MTSPPPSDLAAWRKAQRSDLLARRMAVAADLHRERNDAITRLLLDGFPILQWMTVGFYWPFKGEFDARFAIHRLRECGTADFSSALPAVVQKHTPLQFRQWWPGAPVVKAVFGLPVPDGTPQVTPQALLIPPIGFDRQGYRLGYGGGYFDRTLAALAPQPLKIGVAFECSRIDTIWPQPHDVAMDFIITEAGIHHVVEGKLTHLGDARQAVDLAGNITRARGLLLNRGAGTGAAATVSPYASPACYAHEFPPGNNKGDTEN